MRIFVTMKQAGRRRPLLDKVSYDFPEGDFTLRDILTWFTLTEVRRYNAMDVESPEEDSQTTGSILNQTFCLDKQAEAFLSVFSKEDIEAQAEVGKVNFARRYNGKTADPEKACEVTLEAYADGLVRVFLNDDELADLDEKVDVRDGDIFTFIRLTFLAGRMW